MRGQAPNFARRVIAPLVVACLGVCPLGTLAQTMYKWVDEKGVTHFSENPPPDGTKGAAKIEVKPASPDKVPVDNWKQRELESKQKRAAKNVRDENARRQEESQAARRCNDAKRRVDMYTHARGVYNLNEKGERVYLEEKERETALQEAKQEIARSCS
ncbi:MAG TPA: DUF4124 domain-containing protein [Usitatibacter sp.]|nr:DUF4124 domain-containing protein [Usitatibacter sp.]